MSTQYRAVVIGAGQAGEGHTVALQNAGVDVTAICSRTASVVSGVAKRLGVKIASTDWQKTLESEKPEIVAIATPPVVHAEQIRVGLKLGCHIYTDKPLAIEASESRSLYQESLKVGVRTAVAATWMYDPGIAYLEELVKTGSIGRPLAVDSRFLSPWPYPAAAIWINRLSDGGGVLNSRFSHQLAAVQRVVGGEVLQATGEARVLRRQRLDMGHLHDYRQWRTIKPDELNNVNLVEVDADDFSIVLLRLGQPGAKIEDSITANIFCASCFQPREGRTITVYGEEGSLHYSWTVDLGNNVGRKKTIVYRTAFNDEEWHGESVPERFFERMPKIANGLHRDWAALARAFMADIRGESHESYPTFRQGWIYQEIVEAVRSKDGWIDIPTDITP